VATRPQHAERRENTPTHVHKKPGIIRENFSAVCNSNFSARFILFDRCQDFFGRDSRIFLLRALYSQRFRLVHATLYVCTELTSRMTFGWFLRKELLCHKNNNKTPSRTISKKGTNGHKPRGNDDAHFTRWLFSVGIIYCRVYILFIIFIILSRYYFRYYFFIIFYPGPKMKFNFFLNNFFFK
jgi:hypothetical protein